MAEPARGQPATAARVPPQRFRVVSVVIPAHDEETTIAATVGAVLAQRPDGVELEVLVVDDASTDATAERAAAAGATVLELGGAGGNPAAARNRGAERSVGDPVVFLDADCTPEDGWLRALLAAHERGATVVGGSLDLPPGLEPTARCDYYCGWYLVHSRRPAGYVPHHPPPNLSVRRDAFFATSRFEERQPYAYTNEERRWQGELRAAGGSIWFEPRARVLHRNRPGLRNLLRRNYRWAYTGIPSKHESGSARLAWLYRRPRLLILASGPLAIVHTAFIVACWLRHGYLEPLLMSPVILASRFAYAAGMMVGGARWLSRRTAQSDSAFAPRWR